MRPKTIGRKHSHHLWMAFAQMLTAEQAGIVPCAGCSLCETNRITLEKAWQVRRCVTSPCLAIASCTRHGASRGDPSAIFSCINNTQVVANEFYDAHDKFSQEAWAKTLLQTLKVQATYAAAVRQ